MACSSAALSLVSGMSIQGSQSPLVCIITFKAVRLCPRVRSFWYIFAISLVSWHNAVATQFQRVSRLCCPSAEVSEVIMCLGDLNTLGHTLQVAL